ncbi:hypothetical protein [Marixanthomonas ophiurae]|uniref:Uncharacterized protein n=1 Tax=Marixanthomonas ophiurae TaxID=387659 RepID=A0A3E1QBQ5_9FLAO|nr:hypothetical protein [Marixanthomonas ophiurae]RFN59524.1 hypothetical protein DZ858_05540 [Marixanthomonas ophiurae]
MNWKKTFKVLAIIIGSLVVIGGVLVGYVYYKYYGKFPVDEEKYSNHIGYINPEKALLTENFKLCDIGIAGIHSSSQPKIYKGGKYAFRNYIQEHYTNDSYTDSGFLIFRFHINCNGETGNVAVSELNQEMQPITMNDDMVQQLLKLTVRKENWQVGYMKDEDGNAYNHYMYVLYKIENGELLEILP